MGITPDRDQITSTLTPHTATRCPGGWAVSWLGDRTVDHNGAITAMLIADHIGRGEPYDVPLLHSLAVELGLTGEQALRMIRETMPPAVLHDTHAIPADDQPALDAQALHEIRDADAPASTLVAPYTGTPSAADEPRPGSVFTDRHGQPWFLIENNVGVRQLVNVNGNWDTFEGIEAAYGPLTRAQIAPADAIVLDRPTSEEIAELEHVLGGGTPLDLGDEISAMRGLTPASAHVRLSPHLLDVPAELSPPNARTLAAHIALAADEAEENADEPERPVVDLALPATPAQPIPSLRANAAAALARLGTAYAEDGTL